VLVVWLDGYLSMQSRKHRYIPASSGIMGC
jgi:hypothetical protein